MVGNLYDELSDQDLEKMRVTFATNQSIMQILDGQLAIRTKIKEEAKVKVDFVAAVDALLEVRTFKTKDKTITTGIPLVWPPDVYNIYLTRQVVDVPNGQPEEIDIPNTDGTPGTHKETRQPTIKVAKIAVELNKGFLVGKSATSGNGGKDTPGKRAINIVHKEGLTLVPVGKYASGQKFVDAHNAAHPEDIINSEAEGGGNSYRAMARHGYLPVDDNGNILSK